MNDLIEIYRRIEYLRNNGLKMKEIADYVDIAPSVLSALYSSVLPTYVTSLKQGHSEEDSLDLALAQVNNVSKKRLLGNSFDWNLNNHIFYKSLSKFSESFSHLY